MLTAGGGRLAGVDVADNDDVDVSLLLTARSLVAVWCALLRARRFAAW
jgi:hypothetical protein